MEGVEREMIGVFRRSHDEVSAQVSGFKEGDLLRMSGATEWNVAQVLSHLGSSSEIALTALRSGSPHREGYAALWAKWDAMAPDVQATQFVRAEEELVTALEALDDESLMTGRIDMGFMPAPVDVKTFLAFRLSEVGLHRWDVDVAFWPDATVATYLVPLLVDGIPPMAPMLARPSGANGTIKFELADLDRTMYLRLAADRTEMTEGRGDEPDSVVRLPADSFVRLVNGRLRPEHTPSSVLVEGEFALDEVRRLFPGY